VFAIWWLSAMLVGRIAPIDPISVAFAPGWWSVEPGSQLLWYGLFALMFTVATVGYWFVWPMGTRSHGRPLHRWWGGAFGLVWGLSEALLYVTVWSLIRSIVDSDWTVLASSFVLIALATGGWHQMFWDRYVAPVHNAAEWNVRKVLLVHMPFLFVSLTFITLFESGLLFIAAQVIALIGSSIAMRFPSPFDPDTLIDGSPLDESGEQPM
jgi:hypothetical protein